MINGESGQLPCKGKTRREKVIGNSSPISKAHARLTSLLYFKRWQDTGRYVLAAPIQVLEGATDLRDKDTAKAYRESLERQETIEAILLYLT